MDVTVRSGTHSDVPALRIVRSQAIETTYSDVYDRDRFADLVVEDDDRLRSALDGDRTVFLVAETAVTPVGYALVDLDTGRIDGIYTSPDYRREGVATALLSHVEEQARNASRLTLRGSVPDPVRPFFDANGFQERGDAEWRGLPSTEMEKPLDG